MLQAAPPVKADRTRESGHYYGMTEKGDIIACHTIPMAKDKSRQRPATKADCKKCSPENPIIIDGIAVVRLVPSVTTVLSVTRKAMLNSWRERKIILRTQEFPKSKTEDIDHYIERIRNSVDKISADAADLGTQVHKALEDSDRGLSYESSYSGYVEAVESEKRLMGFKPVFTEYFVMDCKLGYGGCVDLIGKVGKRKAIIDYKTRKNINIYPDDPVQIAAYGHAIYGDNFLRNGNGYSLVASTTNVGEVEHFLYDNQKLRHSFNKFKHLCNYWWL
jgi:hypothetical protein